MDVGGRRRATVVFQGGSEGARCRVGDHADEVERVTESPGPIIWGARQARLDLTNLDLTSLDLTSLDLTSLDLTSQDALIRLTSVFVGRARELEVLEKAYRGRRSALVPVYGRRRVGKSELLLRFARGKPSLYYVGKQAPAALQQKELAREAAVVLDEPLLAQLSPTSWKDLLIAVTDRYQGEGKLVVILDEFQWMAQASPELPSVLQELWDRRFRDGGRIFLVLCGSFIGFMEREVLGKQSPLFGRRTAQMLLQPFDHREAAEFHPGWSVTDQARVRFLCGGVPMYLRCFDSSQSVEKGIETQLLDDYAPLHREPEFLLREELREVQVYYAVLRAIATGKHAHAEIARASGIPDRNVHYYLNTLVSLGYVARRYPLSGGKVTNRSVRYVLEDPLLRFWFRFVFPNLSYLSQMGPARTFRDRIKPDLDGYFGDCFERLCREALPFLYRDEGLNASFEVGEFWAKDVQIDVVGLREDGWTDIGECKWGTVRSPKALLAELESKVSRYPNPRNATIGRRVFVRSRPRRLPEGARWHALEDLYGRRE